MILRPPAVPLITVDPYFSVWSPSDKLNDEITMHWTGKPNTILGIANIDRKDYRFLGKLPNDETPAMAQVARDMNAFSSTYVFEDANVRLTAIFTTPLLLDDLDICSRPVSYLKIKAESLDGNVHNIKIDISVSEELCLNYRGQEPVITEYLAKNAIQSVRMGGTTQDVLGKKGDDIRIDWGYFYLSVKENLGDCYVEKKKVDFIENMPHGEDENMTFIGIKAEIDTADKNDLLVTFAYDDIKSIHYFGSNCSSYWNKDGKSIVNAIEEAFEDYDCVLARCKKFADKMFIDSVRAGGEKYAELLELAYRQTIAAHKIAVDDDGEIIFISKECFSNGCAATVDVSYPSIPLYLLYNPELVCGMMRPIFKYAKSKEWKFDFAPHDAGCYPIVTGQVYGNNELDKQMPVEECGNMLIMAANVVLAGGNIEFIKANLDILETWVKCLEENGSDPKNQLCTDDFAGHLAHNCNLSLKAISGIAGLGLIYGKLGDEKKKQEKLALARNMAKDWAVRASNGDGSYRLAFDKTGTWSMKYNIVWDKIWGTNLMDKSVIFSEFASYSRHINAYGMPLDNRSLYTKSDWLVWTATLADNRTDFEKFIAPMWDSFNIMQERVPMTDWYFTNSAKQHHFRNRSVQGGLFIKLLEYSGKLKA